MPAPHDDTLQRVLNDAQSVQWAALRGAYGASDATDHYRDAPGMLLTLATVNTWLPEMCIEPTAQPMGPQ